MKGDPRDAHDRLAGFEDVRPLGGIAALEYLSARERRSGAARVLVAARSGVEGAVAAVHEIARIHSLLGGAHPCLAPVAALHDDFVALDSAAVANMEALIERLRTTRYRVDEDSAAAFVNEVFAMLQAAHAIIDPTTDRPVCLGTFAAANILAAEDGALTVLGWGMPQGVGARARFLGDITSYAAPEVAFGSTALPGSDLAAAAHFFHSFLGFQEPPPALVAALGGDALDGYERLPGLVVELMSVAHAPLPEQRSIARFLELWAPALACLGVRPDVERLRVQVRAVVADSLRALDGPRLQVGPRASWLRLGGGEVIELTRRGPLRRIVWALVEARVQRPGAATSGDLLFEAGWPGEAPSPESARNRLHVALSSLRNLGLRELVTRRDDGYLILPEVHIERVEASTPPE